MNAKQMITVGILSVLSIALYIVSFFEYGFWYTAEWVFASAIASVASNLVWFGGWSNYTISMLQGNLPWAGWVVSSAIITTAFGFNGAAYCVLSTIGMVLIARAEQVQREHIKTLQRGVSLRKRLNAACRDTISA